MVRVLVVAADVGGGDFVVPDNGMELIIEPHRAKTLTA